MTLKSGLRSSYPPDLTECLFHAEHLQSLRQCPQPIVVLTGESVFKVGHYFIRITMPDHGSGVVAEFDVLHIHAVVKWLHQEHIDANDILLGEVQVKSSSP